MLKRIRTYIEEEPWDEEMLRQDRIMSRFIYVVIILAVLYFAPVCLKIFIASPLG